MQRYAFVGDLDNGRALYRGRTILRVTRQRGRLRVTLTNLATPEAFKALRQALAHVALPITVKRWHGRMHVFAYRNGARVHDAPYTHDMTIELELPL